MNKTTENSLSSLYVSRWVLLSLTALCWLVVCVWLLKTETFGASDNLLFQNGPQSSSLSRKLKPELEQVVEAEVPRLTLIKEGSATPETADSQAAADSTGRRIGSNSVVINVDVSTFTALDRAQDLFLDGDVVRQYPTSLSGLADERQYSIQVEGTETGNAKIEPSTTHYERLRQTELSVLEGLSTQIRFNSNSVEVNPELERVLDRMFDPLYLYSEIQILVSMATNELAGAATNNLLSRGRAEAMVAYWVIRGLEVDRFSIFIEPGDELPFGAHRVRVFPEGIN